MKKLSTILMAVILSAMFVFTSSCTYRMMDFTIVSSKNVDLGGIDKSAQRVSGKHTTISPANAVKEAIDNAIEKAGPGYDALVDGVIRVTSYYAVFLFIYVYEAEGTPIKTTQLKADLGEAGFEKWINEHEILNPETAEIIYK